MTDFRKADISKQESYDLLRDWIKLVARHTNPDQDISELLGWLWKLKPATPDPITGLMLKRSEGCDFCNESERIQNQYGDIMEMDDGVLILDTEGYPKVTFRIKYCPDCGRELSGNAEQVKEAGNEQAGSVRIPLKTIWIVLSTIATAMKHTAICAIVQILWHRTPLISKPG